MTERAVPRRADAETPLRVLAAWRPVPARTGEEHPVVRLLRGRGLDVRQADDGHLPLERFDVVLLLENPRWFPTILRDLGALGGRRPLAVAWHWEPLPLPRAAGVPAPRLHVRELAKILLRDRRATDLYSNRAALRRLRARGLPDLLIVSSRAWQESLAEDGVEADWIPYGYDAHGDSPDGGGPAIGTLFLGALDVPRRRRILRDLGRRGVDVTARGSWHSPEFWGASRSSLVCRAEALLNLPRYPGQVSAERLLLGMAHHTLVVSEPLYRPEPFVPGEHYVEADLGDIPEVLHHYREHPAERERITDCAYRLATTELRMDVALDRLLDRIRDHSRGPGRR